MEFLGAGGPPTEKDAADGCRVVSHHRRCELRLDTVPAFRVQLGRSPNQQTGNETFHHRTAVASRTGHLDLV